MLVAYMYVNSDGCTEPVTIVITDNTTRLFEEGKQANEFTNRIGRNRRNISLT